MQKDATDCDHMKMHTNMDTLPKVWLPFESHSVEFGVKGENVLMGDMGVFSAWMTITTTHIHTGTQTERKKQTKINHLCLLKNDFVCLSFPLSPLSFSCPLSVLCLGLCKSQVGCFSTAQNTIADAAPGRRVTELVHVCNAASVHVPMLHLCYVSNTWTQVP